MRLKSVNRSCNITIRDKKKYSESVVTSWSMKVGACANIYIRDKKIIVKVWFGILSVAGTCQSLLLLMMCNLHIEGIYPTR